MHRLIVIRHAKSDWPEGVPDHGRPLGERGRRDAPAAGQWLQKHDLTPDIVAVSTATRTLQTWQLLAEQFPVAPDSFSVDRVYAASWQELLAVVQEFPEDCRTAALVGHNPGCEELATSLAGSGSMTARTAMARKYPTCGIAVLRLVEPWAQTTTGSAELVEFHIPRG